MPESSPKSALLIAFFGTLLMIAFSRTPALADTEPTPDPSLQGVKILWFPKNPGENRFSVVKLAVDGKVLNPQKSFASQGDLQKFRDIASQSLMMGFYEVDLKLSSSELDNLRAMIKQYSATSQVGFCSTQICAILRDANILKIPHLASLTPITTFAYLLNRKLFSLGLGKVGRITYRGKSELANLFLSIDIGLELMVPAAFTALFTRGYIKHDTFLLVYSSAGMAFCVAALRGLNYLSHQIPNKRNAKRAQQSSSQKP